MIASHNTDNNYIDKVGASKDWIGMLYQVEKKLGRSDTFDFILHYKNKKFEAHSFSHEHTDGMGALLRLFPKLGFQGFNAPARQPLNWSMQAVCAGTRSFFTDLKPVQTPLLHHNKTVLGPTPSSNKGWFYLNATNSALLLRALKAQSINVTAAMLHCCHVVVARKLLDSSSAQRKWMLPINMRTAQEALCEINRSTAIGIDLTHCKNINDTQALYKKAVNPWTARLNYWASQIGFIVGVRGLTFLAKQRGERNNWLGTFTNLGAIDTKSLQTKHAFDSDKNPVGLTVLPPAGTPCFPIGFGLASWNGVISLGLRLHQSIDPEIVHAEDLLKDIILELSLICGEEILCQNSWEHS